MTAAVTAIVMKVMSAPPQMCSQASKNARQRPKLTSPSANIAGSQTNTFIDPSEAAPQGKTTALPAPNAMGALQRNYDGGRVVRAPVNAPYRLGEWFVKNS
jgi:hypothetical protein